MSWAGTAISKSRTTKGDQSGSANSSTTGTSYKGSPPSAWYQAQDMAENNVDYAHFRYVHGTDAIPEDEFHVEGTYKRAVGLDGAFVREGFGLGLGVLRIAGAVTFISSTTPIDEQAVHVRWIFTAPRAAGPTAATDAADSFCEGVSQDIPIWENKVYRSRPVLTRTERPIIEHRRWARQFYSNYDEVDAVDDTEA